jgi:hypothetical protein
MADALQPLMLRGFLALSGRAAPMRVPDVLIQDQSAGYDLDFDSIDEAVLVDFRETTLVTKALASDSCRFATAAFQSAVAGEMCNRDTAAWSMVKLYYAAFYAGHALIRLMGESVSQFDYTHVNHLDRLSAALGKAPPFKIDGGFYRCTMNTAATGFAFTRAKGRKGGAHEAFWEVLGKRLEISSAQILAGPLPPADAQLVFNKIGSFADILKRNGSKTHSWLSVFRNTLQYQHGFGVWFPAKLRQRECDVLNGLARQWKRNPMDCELDPTDGGEIGRFVAGCTFLIAVCRDLTKRIAERSTAGNKSFITFGPLAYLREAGL